MPYCRPFIALTLCGSGVLLNDRRVLLKSIAIVLLTLGVTGVAMAGVVPEIDPGTGVSALALLGGALLVIRGRRRR
jgi:hypothetical protein